jgi:hypothetical protein
MLKISAVGADNLADPAIQVAARMLRSLLTLSEIRTWVMDQQQIRRVGATEETAPVKVIARIPDVDAVDVIPFKGAKAAIAGKRLLGEGLSAKLLLGSGLLLLILAIVPFLFNKKDGPTSKNETAATWQPAATPATASSSAAQTGKAPTWNDTLAKWDKSKTAESKQSAEPDRTAESKKQAELKQPNLGGEIVASVSTNDPPRQDPIASSNRSMTIGQSQTAQSQPSSEERTVARRDYAIDSPVAPQTSAQYAAQPNVPVGLADRRIENPVSTAIDKPQIVPASEPGLARLHGTIETYPVRTNNDRARPSIY